MKRWALLLALILLGPATPGRAAVSFVSAVAMSSTAANTAFTLAFTVDSSANRFLGVFIATSGSTATLSTATWNGTSLTSPLSGAANGGTLHEYFAYLANPTNATANVVVNLAAAPSSCFGMIACEYAGVDPFAPYDVGTATSGSSTTLLGFLTSTFASDQFLDAPFLLGSGTLTNDGTLTQRVTIAPNNVSNIFRLNDKALTTAQYYAISNTASVSNPWDQLVVAIKQVQPTATPTFTATPSWTPTPTATATATATPTNTPVIASLVTSAAYTYCNSPTITIPWTPSASGVDETLAVILHTNNNDNASMAQLVSYAGNSFYPQVQVASKQYSEGIELWTIPIGSYPYSGFTSGNIVITQPTYNTIINEDVTVLEYGGTAQAFALNCSYNSSPQQALQTTTISGTLTSLFQRSFVLAAFSGVKPVITFPNSFTNLQYFHKYGTWASVDEQGPVGPAAYTASYTTLPPYNPAASVLMAEIPSYSYFTPTITPTPHP